MGKASTGMLVDSVVRLADAEVDRPVATSEGEVAEMEEWVATTEALVATLEGTRAQARSWDRPSHLCPCFG